MPSASAQRAWQGKSASVEFMLRPPPGCAGLIPSRLPQLFLLAFPLVWQTPVGGRILWEGIRSRCLCHIKADWAYSLPIKDRTVKLVLAQLCDAFTESDGCFPSIARIAKRVVASERTVQRTLNRLEALGAIKRHFTGRATRYIIDFEWQPRAPDVASEVTSGVTTDPTLCVTSSLLPRGDIPAPRDDTDVTSDPTSFGTLTQRTQLEKLNGESPLPPSDLGGDGADRCSCHSAKDAWNETAERCAWPRVQRFTPSRTKALEARLGELGGLLGWHAMLGKMEASTFFRKRWIPSFDWVLKPANLLKIMEGNYDGKLTDVPDRGLTAALAALSRPIVGSS